jgi:PilZ domain
MSGGRQKMTQTIDRFRLFHIAPPIRDESFAIIQEADDRCGQRHKVKIQASLRRAGDKPFSVIVRDISVSGFSCEAVSSVRPGSLVWITFPGLTGLQSEVSWNDGVMIGCAFSDLMNRAVLDRLMTRS